MLDKHNQYDYDYEILTELIGTGCLMFASGIDESVSTLLQNIMQAEVAYL